MNAPPGAVDGVANQLLECAVVTLSAVSMSVSHNSMPLCSPRFETRTYWLRHPGSKCRDREPGLVCRQGV